MRSFNGRAMLLFFKKNPIMSLKNVLKKIRQFVANLLNDEYKIKIDNI